ncbi:hypothetical protein RRG08_034990 [Elysia crispata]|uniref:Uncharacterized protein n=1 Tax=Elysia crispata TaxID=231223 RepID=A0AAE0Y2M3_9GAST|nr:hypothetical protein RRG08_034990 [Elysia crispata]
MFGVHILTSDWLWGEDHGGSGNREGRVNHQNIRVGMERGSLGQRKQGRKGKSSKYKGRDGEGITGAAETGKEG